MYGADLIADERSRQIGEEEHWTSDHDDKHTDQSLADAAAYLARPHREIVVPDWSRDLSIKHQNDRVRELVIAGALIAAEIDRLLRKGAQP